MKPNLYMKLSVVLILAVLLLPLKAQTNHSVAVSSNKFEPNELTIRIGDTVTWTNNGGSHNVNGTQATFPDNPASFSNDVGTGWTFSFVFTDTGTYDYQCDPHAGFGMAGKVIVVGETTGLFGHNADRVILAYPNPARNNLNIVFKGAGPFVSAELAVYNVVGEKVLVKNVVEPMNSLISLDVSTLQNGLYILQSLIGNEKSSVRFIKE